TALAANVISGNTIAGIQLFGSSDNNLFEGNFIGTDAQSDLGIGNGRGGIGLSNGPANNTIGGTAPGARNVISGNGGAALGDSGNGNTLIQGNYIGTNVSGTAALGNAGVGVDMAAANATIGGTTAAAGNLISGNTGDGVDLISSGAVLEGNYIGT